MTVYDPIHASSYPPLPQILKSKKALINIQNNDEKCFLWCVLAQLHPAENHADRVSNYIPHENEPIVNGLEFPVTVSAVDKFERLNNNRISINIFCFEEDKLMNELQNSKLL